MADVITDGMIRVFWVTAIANQNAPTVAELNAGIRLDTTMTADGMAGFDPDTASIATSKFSSRFDSARPGRVSYSGMSLQFCKQDGTDTVYNTLPYNTSGFVVVRRDLDANTAWAVSQKVQVYPCSTGERRLVNPEPNSLSRWIAPLFPSGAQPSLDAVVA